MNLINCEKCGVLFDKDVLLRILKERNEKSEFLSRTSFLDCPVCKDKNQFNFLSEDIYG
jgi:phage FluMu protein Com